MPSQIVAHVPPSGDLAILNREVAQGEQVFGTLAGIGNDGSTTTLTFAATGLPTSPATVAPQVAGHPVVPAGQTLVCTGTVFVSGVLTLCAATR